MFNLVLAAVFLVAAISSGVRGVASVVPALVVAAAMVGLLLSARVHGELVDDGCRFVGYFRTHEFKFDEDDAYFVSGYSGFWTRYEYASERWWGFGMRMIEVERRSGSTIELPATLMGVRGCTEIVHVLQARSPAKWLDSPIE